MYHVFLLIKDGFFHITNLALAKIETGIKTACVVDLKFYWRHCVDHIKHLFFYQHSHWKHRSGSFERGKLKQFSVHAIANIFLSFFFTIITLFLNSAPVAHQDRLLLHQWLPRWRLQHSSDVQSGPRNPLNDRGQCLREVIFIYLPPAVMVTCEWKHI